MSGRKHRGPARQDLRTTLRSAEKALSESEEALRHVIAGAPFGAHIYRLDADGRLILTQTNAAADRILKIDHAPLLGKTIEEAFPGLVETPIPATYKDVAENGTTYSNEQVDYDEGAIKGAFDVTAFRTSPRRIAVFFVDITDRKRTELALAEEAAHRRILFDHTTAGVAQVAVDGRYLMVNPAYSEIFGYSPEEFSGIDFLAVTHPDDAELSRRIRLEVLAANGAPVRYTKRYLHKDGHTIWAELTSALVRAADGSPSYFITHLTDVTERRRAAEENEKLQAQLAQAQKMESVGRLAGGVAHDFNNMLGVILGHADLALEQVPLSAPVRADLEEIMQAAQRSADLTRQLLAFARRQTAEPRVLDLGETISGMLRWLRRLIGEDIDLTWAAEDGLWPVRIDPAQLDQILANLCVNARDAIAGVGLISIQARNVTLDEGDPAAVAGLAAGDFVVLTVCDNGSGMEREVLDHIFEPFYTTKGPGRGTGLGLATVYGIVRQNDGVINARSEPGTGTTFNIYLPRVSGRSDARTIERGPETWCANGETVLLVEDEPAMLRLGQAMLERLGFTVLSARTPADAVRIADERSGAIDVLLTDVVMPGMNGRDLAAHIGTARPDMACVFISGYTADVIAHRGLLDKGVHFLQKPFSTAELSRKIREALESRRTR
jgi:two-component system, cell cycle sensor histidine kinase and response regulator CckA